MLFEKIKLEEDEDVLLIVRRHWFVLFNRILGVVIVLCAPFVLFIVFQSLNITASHTTRVLAEYPRELLFFASLWILGNWMTLAYVWTDQYLDIWVITDRRIISIDQLGLFVRSVGSFRLERLQDMNIEIPGFFATLLDYGTVEAQTASASESEFTVHGVPKPREIKSIILEAADIRMRKMSEKIQRGTDSGL